MGEGTTGLQFSNISCLVALQESVTWEVWISFQTSITE